MKILIVSFNFPPQIGGVAEIARRQACAFASRGHEVTVATEFDPSRDNVTLCDGVTIQQFKIGSTIRPALAETCQIESYRQTIANQVWNVILFNCWQNRATDLGIPVLQRSPAKKVMVSQGFDAHIWSPHPLPFWGLKAWLRSQPYVWRLPGMMKAFDQLVFLSARRDRGRFFDHWVAAHLFPSRISIIPNGSDLSEFCRDRGDFRTAYGIQTPYMVLNVANYCDRKNQLATVQDFMKVDRPDTTLVLIGAEFNHYQALAARWYEENRSRFQHARVLFLEKVPKNMVYAAYEAATAFILSAKAETQPLAILDAMAAGVPFISTSTGCVSEFPGGTVVRAGPETTMAIRQLLDDPALRQKLAAEGRAACQEKYDWKRIFDAFEALFARLGASTAPARL